MPRIPKLGLHKPTGQYRVNLNGKTKYLGKDKAEAQRRYKSLVSDFLSGKEEKKTVALTSTELGLQWLSVAQPSVGKPEADLMRQMTEILPEVDADKFKLAHARAMKSKLIERDLCRKTINKYIRYLRAMYQWAFEEELVSAQAAATVQLVRNLKPGQAKENPPVRAVSDSVIEKTIPSLEKHSRKVADMVRIHRLLGCRPGELVGFKWSEVDTSGEVWLWSPRHHKTAYRGHVRQIPIGPAAQKLLMPWREAEQPFKMLRTSYSSLVRRACDDAGVERWSPNQLRHARLSEIRKAHGLDAAQAVASHTSSKTTEVYAVRNDDLAIEAARKSG